MFEPIVNLAMKCTSSILKICFENAYKRREKVDICKNLRS